MIEMGGDGDVIMWRQLGGMKKYDSTPCPRKTQKVATCV